MKRLFLDTNAIVALINEQDELHPLFMPEWERIEKNKTPLIMTRDVFTEVVNFFAFDHGPREASSVGAYLLKSSLIQIINTNTEDHWLALDLITKYADQGIGYTDCTSFAVMQRLGLKQVLTYDHHFAIAGFELVPGLMGKRRKRR